MPPPDVGASSELFVEFPLGSWSFKARIVEAAPSMAEDKRSLSNHSPTVVGAWVPLG